MRNTKRISASNFFYGVAAILLVVQLALILWILKYQFVLTIYDGIPGTIAVVVSTVIPAFWQGSQHMVLSGCWPRDETPPFGPI